MQRKPPAIATTSSDLAAKSILIGGTAHPVKRIEAGLYCVATPIGNLGDMTLRAAETLGAADLILCEDTRHTRRLTEQYGIKTPLKPLHEHNERERLEEVLELLSTGIAIALVSDAGTPLISDPGYSLVRAAKDAGHAVYAVPGPSAVIAALSVSGLATDAFFFGGFLPPKEAAREGRLRSLEDVPGTLVFYEAPNRLVASLRTAERVYGKRMGAVARELTKTFEEVVRAPISALIDEFSTRDAVKGEIVLMFERGTDHAPPSEQMIDTELRKALASMRVRDAADLVSAALGVPRKVIYKRALDMKNDQE